MRGTMELVKSEDVKRIFHNKFVVIIGDSVQRSVYKDIVLLLQENRLLELQELKYKGEHEFLGDKLIEGGLMEKMTNGKSYREVRQYQTDVHLVRFYFVTRCYSRYMQTVLADLAEELTPDVIIMTSCIWDISRYGPYGIPQYQKNLQRFFHHLQTFHPPETLFIWTTTMPISSNIRGGFMLDYISFMQETLRLDIIEANFFAAQVTRDYGHDVLDLHYNFRHLQHHRVKDGVHWNATAHRYISQLLLDHVARAWHLPVTTKQTFNIPSIPRRDPVNGGGRTWNFPKRCPRRKPRSISCCPAILNDTPLHFSNKQNPHIQIPVNKRYPPVSIKENLPPSRGIPNFIASDRGFWMDKPPDFHNDGYRLDRKSNFRNDIRNVVLNENLNSACSSLEKSYNPINCNSYDSTWNHWGWSENVRNVDVSYSVPRNVPRHEVQHHSNNYGPNGQAYSQYENLNFRPPSWNHNQDHFMYDNMGEQYQARQSGPMRNKRGHPFRPYNNKRHVQIQY